MKINSRKPILQGAAILTVAGLITKVLSAGYRIPFQNIVGDIGFFIYQQVYPFYGVAVVLSTYGFPVIISKLIAEYPEKDRRIASEKIGMLSLFILSIIGIIAFLLIFINGNSIANFMRDSNLAGLIKISAFSFLLLPLVSVLRGVFQGENNMVPTAVSQIVEQSVRVGLIIFFAYYLLLQGKSLYEIGSGAIAASVVGSFIAILILAFFYIRRGTTSRPQVKPTIKSRLIIKKLLTQGITICISSLLLILLSMVDAFTVYRGLILAGFEEEVAKSLKGVFDRGQPFIQLGTVVATSFSLSLVPSITMALVDKENKDIEEKIHLSLRVSILIGMGAAAGLATLIKPINTMLFTDDNQSFVLMILSISILFSSITLTGAAILQGLNHPYIPAVFVSIGIVSKLILNELLLPRYHILGAAIATVISLGVVAYLTLLFLKRIVQVPIFGKEYSWIVFKSTIGMVLALMIYMQIPLPLDDEREIIRSLTGVIIGGSLFLFISLRSGYFSEKELLMLPLGRKLLKILK